MTDQTTTPLDRDALDALGREYDALMQVAAATDARMTEIKRLWAAQLDFGPHIAADLKVSIQHNVTRDNKAFMAAYPFEQYPDFYKAVPDTDSITENLAPAELRKFQREGTPKVVISRFEA